MKHIVIIVVIGLTLVLIGLFLAERAHAPVEEEGSNEVVSEPLPEPESVPGLEMPPPVTHELITVNTPLTGEIVSSPLTISGEARGYWFFEASFPILLVNWNGLIIAEHYATADGEWMTEEYVPFTAELEFENPYNLGDPEFMRRGAIILQRSNASGLPENDDAIEIPLIFAE